MVYTIEDACLHIAYEEINSNPDMPTFYCVLAYINKQDGNDTH